MIFYFPPDKTIFRKEENRRPDVQRRSTVPPGDGALAHACLNTQTAKFEFK